MDDLDPTMRSYPHCGVLTTTPEYPCFYGLSRVRLCALGERLYGSATVQNEHNFTRNGHCEARQRKWQFNIVPIPFELQASQDPDMENERRNPESGGVGVKRTQFTIIDPKIGGKRKKEERKGEQTYFVLEALDQLTNVVEKEMGSSLFTSSIVELPPPPPPLPSPH
ncbi:hypothetical protein V1477_000768 [Vespula maculifrons]|uniref:Uncharacterized protein n=1 Tax=Vespula maculifrons TaxID=7453 RepID=A0ABD2CZW5_VESMC